ncbi:MAG: ribose-phosphate diphosphokinase [Caulobacteraceae bacterium]|nr:ribose-phosphate diphosphokinase [Caulobacteraceae bacterium]
MIPLTVQAFEDQAPRGRALAAELGAPFAPIALHRFPDGELMPVVQPARTVVAYCSLDHPNEKLIALLLAADAWRRAGVRRLVLVAPYLCYLRQDAVFHPGEPLSRDAVCGLLGACFDRVVTVDAHLHRTRDLSAAFGGIEADDLSASIPLAEALAGPERPLVVGPDAESGPWAGRIAERLGGEALMFSKTRKGDETVRLAHSDLTSVWGRHVLLVDDICSSGATLVAAAERLHAAGAASIDVGVVHALFGREAGARMKAAGVRAIVSTDSIVHPTNRAPLAGVLAAALQSEIQA